MKDQHDVAGGGKTSGRRRPTGLERGCSIAYAALAWAFVAGVAYQVFLAGMAVFVDAGNWIRHVSFVHTIELIPIVMLMLSFIGKMPRGQGLYLRPTLLFLLTGTQYALAAAGPTIWAALHPVNALVIFWIAALLAMSVRPGRNGVGKVWV